jgi:hypothetical protein
MIVDCGCTVDLTTRKFLNSFQLSEITTRIRDYCGSSFVDNTFIKFLREKLGTRAMDLLMENDYDQFQHLVREFCQYVKEPFTGNDFRFCYDLDIDEIAPALLQYVNEETKERMEKSQWLIKIKYDDIKSMFDPIIEKIIRLIHEQLDNTQEACSAMFLVGGFCVNKYLQKRIKQEFNHKVKTISVPAQPLAAISRGAVIYGLSLR